MRYRIVEFKVADAKGNRFFLEVGTEYREHFWAFIYLKKIRWELHSEHKEWAEALKVLEILKQSEPIYHLMK